MRYFVNDVNTCVTEALEGVALGSFGNLAPVYKLCSKFIKNYS